VGKRFDYEVLLTLDVVNELPPTRIKREFVLSAIKELESKHHWGGDYKVFSSKRNSEIEVTKVKNTLLFWLVDHPVKQVHLVNIEKV